MARKFIGVNPATGKKLYSYDASDPALQQDMNQGLVGHPTTDVSHFQNDLQNHDPLSGLDANANPYASVTDVTGNLPPEATPPTQSIGDQLGSVADQIGGGLKTLGAGAVNFFAPRTKQFVQGYAQDFNTAMNGTPEEKQAVAQRLTDPRNIRDIAGGPVASEVNRTIGKITGNKDMTSPYWERSRGAAGEMTGYALPSAGVGIGATPVSRILNTVGASALAGGIHGFTSPNALTLGEQTKDAATQGFISGAIALALAGGAEGVRAIKDKLSGAGDYIAGRMIHPNVGKSLGWSNRESDAINTMMENTKGNTPEAIDRNATEAVRSISKDIISDLSKNTKTIPLQATITNPDGSVTQSVEDALNEGYKQYIAGFNPNSPEFNNATAQVTDILTKNSTALPNGDFATSPLGSFKAKQAIGNLLRGSKSTGGVWDKIAAGGEPTPAEQVLLVAYDKMKDITDSLAPNTSTLTQLEHQLMQVSTGAFQAAHRMRAPALINLPLIPSAGPMVTQPLQMAAARALHGLGNTPRIVDSVVNKLIGGAVGATTATQE